ncbi:MAG: cysteine peptidase family C39 domain-containing protein [Bacilli bacterium]|nr:cysteine peptidase family C39 domain-containing protein [Bacilli bacterium]
MKDFVYQINQNECGYASLKMLLAIVLKDSAYLFLPHHEDKNHQYDLLELKEIAKANGVLLAGYIINNQHDLLNLKTPFIMVKTLANGGKHAVVVKKIYKSLAIVYDPALGKKTVRTKKYFSLNHNVEVLQVESHSFVSRTFDMKPLLSNKERAKNITCEVLAIMFYFFATYFLGKEFDIIIPLVLMVIGALFSIIFKGVSISTMKRFDEEFIEFTYSNNLTKREENYRLMHKTKSGLLNSTTNIILTLSSSLLINVILILQNTIAVYIIISSLALVVIDAAFIDPWIKNKSYDLEKLESSILKKENLTKEEYLNNYSEIKDMTYKIARLVGLKRLIGYFILLILTLVLSRMSGSVDIYFVIFHFTMCMFTYVSLDNVYKMVDTSKENQINQVKFHNLINENTKK